MKVSMRFELLMQQRRLQPDSAELNDNELLGQLISKFNSHKATSALKKWQITGDQHQAMLGIICGLSAAARSLIRSHLDWNKYEQSGSLASSETTSVSFGLILLLWVWHSGYKEQIDWQGTTRPFCDRSATSYTNAQKVLQACGNTFWQTHNWWLERCSSCFYPPKISQVWWAARLNFYKLICHIATRSLKIPSCLSSSATTTGGDWMPGAWRLHWGHGYDGVMKFGIVGSTKPASQHGWFLKAPKTPTHQCCKIMLGVCGIRALNFCFLCCSCLPMFYVFKLGSR